MISPAKQPDEMEADELTPLDIVESIPNAREICKTIRSTSVTRRRRREYLHIIQSPNLHGLQIYTKGKFVAEGGEETYYFLVSAQCCD
jgi:hypothetical protein